MSDGLKLLDRVIASGSISAFREVPRDLLVDNEVEVYDFLRAHYRRYGDIPHLSTVEEELGVRIPEAEETTDYYIHRIHDRNLYSNIRDRFNSLKEELRNYNMEGAKSIIADLNRVARLSRNSTDIRTLGEAALDVLEGYEYSHANPGLSGVPTGWPLFDLATGGYQPGDLATWVARPSMGKTYVMLQQARMAWRLGFSVLVVTMEMTIPQITRRVIAMESRINPDFLRKGTLSTYARRRLQTCIDGLVSADRFQLFSGGLRKRSSDVELLIQEYRPDIVFIDGVYLMQPESTRSMQKIERVSEVFDNLKQMTIAHNVPVVVTTQFNRQAGKKGKDGSLETIAFTDAISTHSSLVVSLGDGPAPYQVRKRTAKFLKGREGETGEHILNYSFTPMDFSEDLPIREYEDGEERDDTPVIALPSGRLDWEG